MDAPALFLIPYPSNVGYAIDTYQRMFLRAAARLNDGDRSRVHIGFCSTEPGPSRALPSDFRNVVQFEMATPTADDWSRLARYVRDHGITVAMLLDVQPIAPLVPRLRDIGVKTVISYWGAPISDPSPFFKLLLKRLEVLTAGRRCVDSLIFESKAMADLAVTGRGCPRSMLDVVYLGIDPSRFFVTSSKRYVHDTFGIDPKRRIVLFTGHAHERKGIGTLLDAAVILHRDLRRDDVFVLICGDRNDEASQWMQRIEGTGAESIVRFGGYRSDIPQIMSNSDIGVVPSTGWDSFTVSCLEHAASGLPVIVSRLGGLPEGIIEGETGLVVEPSNARDLAAKIAFLLDHPDDREGMGRKGRERVLRDFTLEVNEQRLTEVLERRITESARS
jgi:glycosyltransferase involved in cell wall biosynthesis